MFKQSTAIIFLLICVSSKAQSFWEIDSLFCQYPNWRWEIFKNGDWKIDTNVCKKRFDEAKADFESGKYYHLISGCFSIDSDTSYVNTFHYILENQYGFPPYPLTVKWVDNFDCYEFHQDILVYKKFGDNFYGKVWKTADSLDKLGLGYVPPEYKLGNQIFPCEFNCNLNIKGLSDSVINESYYLVLNIDTSGRFNEYSIMENKVPSAKYLEMIDKTIPKLNTFEPASFMGQKIESRWLVHVGGWKKKEKYYYEMYRLMKRNKGH